MATKKLISRAEVLGGMGGRTAKQAHALVALIETRTAHLVAQAAQAGSVALTIAAVQTPRHDFLEALAQGRTAQAMVTIQELERFAPHWAPLVPANPEIRAAVAHLLGQRYAFTAPDTPELGAALGVALPPVQAAHQRLYQQPLAQIYAPQVAPSARLQWGWAHVSRRLESLPPFWLAFLLTMPGAAGLLALPIALAQVGITWGLLLVLGFGLINLLTALALAETVVRSGTARFGLGFLGQLAHEYLGKEASFLLTIVLAANNFLVLIIFFLGVAGTLGGGAPTATVLWLLPFAAVVIYVLSRRSLNTTVAVTLLIVLANLLILLLIPLLALPYFQLANLRSGAGGAAFTPVALGSTVGVLASTFLSHFVVATYGPVVLPREPSGRAWMQGSASAIVSYILIACLWLLVINGVLSPTILSQSNGAVVIPLAAMVGSAVQLLGSLLVILSVGLTALQVALGLYYLVEERLPPRGAASVIGRLGAQPRFALAISPILVALAVTIWLALSGMGSFTTLLGIVSVFTLPLVTGILPLLLLVATRRKGDFAPGFVLRWLGNPLVIGLLYLFSLATILIHGLYIWEAWPLRLAALGGTLVLVVATVRIWRQGLLAGRTVLTVCHDGRLHGTSQVQVVSNGRPLPVAMELCYRHHQQQVQSAHAAIAEFAALQVIRVHLPATAATQLKLWLYQLTPAGQVEGLPAHLVLTAGAATQTTVSTPTQGPALYPVTGACQIEIRLADQPRA